MSPDIQMFQHGFFPASFNKPKTAFTFRVLNNFLLDNLECCTSTMNYYSKLQRHYINKALGKDRYRELMRVARQWRQLKTMKWHGFGHRSNALNAKDLALFCPTCPQPRINISLSGNETLDELLTLWKHLAATITWAINQANVARHKLESTGIGGVACACHGCFVPHVMVDFQKGRKASRT
ncbi:uncharacterized protein EDB93DRAFT_1243196 [Suillus bovinus]|uniref:uncharacterized protein n=1 Tax=Suillus bovinus TaxID=48563 RepID=UPI001B85DD11|nr:uncharacterized protein EDB93DRAFT_1243196 [Suillus bovinus]KAG2130934.1 hypothetical protein EDB93DRAFT_1243196 [Suillus bovinus]